LLLLDLALRRDSPARLAPFLFVQAILEWGVRSNPRMRHDVWFSGAVTVVLVALFIALWLSRRRGAEAASAIGEPVSSR
jgi:hypothetical protein